MAEARKGKHACVKDNENEVLKKFKSLSLANDVELEHKFSEDNTEATVGGGNALVAPFEELAFESGAEIWSELRREDEPIFNVMPPVKTFIGRLGEVIELHENLQKPRKPMLVSQCVVISGLGGVGKSELARTYAWEYFKFYKHIIWINCEKKLDTLKSFKKLAEDSKILKPTPDDEERMMDKLPKIYKRLAKVKSLLIFDNVDKFKDIKGFLPLNLTPADEKPAIIITSRNSGWDIGEEGDVDVISLKEFTPDEARSYVKKSLQIKAEDNSCDTLISELIETLCYFPLALHQAVSCIKTKSSVSEAFEEYLKEFRDAERKKNLLETKVNEVNERYTKTTFNTWLVTIENIRKIEGNGGLAIRILAIMSYLSPDDIYFEKIFIKIPEEEEKLEEAIDILVKYSIITVQNKVASIHRLVQLVVRLWLKDKQMEEEVLREILRRVYGYLQETHVASLLSYVCDYTRLMDEYLRMLQRCTDLLDTFKTAFDYHVENGNVCTVRKILDYLELNRDLWPLLYSDFFHAEGLDCHPKNVESTEEVEQDNRENGSKEDGEHEKHIKYVYLFHTEVNKALKTSKTNELEEFLHSFDKSLINSYCDDEMALHKSVKIGNPDVVEVLLKYGADINFCNFEHDYPLNVAIKEKHPEFADYLLDKGADPNPHAHVPRRKPIHYAAMFGYVHIMQRLTDTKEAGESLGEQYWRPLHFAARTDQLEIVEFLINSGVDITAMTEDEETACHIAVASGSIRIVKYLIDNKLVDVNLRNGKKETLLHTAATHQHFNIVKYLLSDETHVKADINGFDHWGVTPLLQAVANGNVEIVRYLIQHGASVDNVQNGTTLLGQLKLSALHFAAALDNFEITKILAEESNADINMGLDTSVSPLQVAKTFNSTKVRNFLLEKGADEFIKDNSENIRCVFLSFVDGKANISHNMNHVRDFAVSLVNRHNFRDLFGERHPFESLGTSLNTLNFSYIPLTSDFLECFTSMPQSN